MLFEVINFVSFYYHESNLFHGDIKPENIFYANEFCINMTSDIGSILYLGE